MSPACYLGETEMKALYAPAVSSECVHLYVLLRSYRSRATGEAFPGRATLARRMGIGERAVSYRLRDLEARGLIVTRSTGRRNHYQFPHSIPATTCTSDLQATNNDCCNAATSIPAMDTQHNKGLEQVRASSAAAHVLEAAERITRWHGRTLGADALVPLAADVLPSLFRRAVDNLTSREPSAVRSPLGLLPRLIADELARSDDF